MLDVLEDYLNARNFSKERIDGSITGKSRQQSIEYTDLGTFESFFTPAHPTSPLLPILTHILSHSPSPHLTKRRQSSPPCPLGSRCCVSGRSGGRPRRRGARLKAGARKSLQMRKTRPPHFFRHSCNRPDDDPLTQRKAGCE